MQPNVIPELVQDTYTMHNILYQLGQQLIARAITEECDEVVLVFDRETLFRLGTIMIQYMNATSGQKPS